MSRAHPVDLAAQLLVEALDRARRRLQDGVAELAHVRAARPRAARAARGRAAVAARPRLVLLELVVELLELLLGHEAPSLDGLLGVHVDAEGDRPDASRSRATASTAAAIAATAGSRSGALTTTWERSRPRRRNSAAGPSTWAPGSSRRSRTARAAPAPRSPRAPSRRCARARRTAGSAARAGARARRPGTRRRRGAAAKRMERRVRRQGLHEHAPAAGAAPGAARELGDQREGPLLRAEVGEAQRRRRRRARRPRSRRGSRGPWRPSGYRGARRARRGLEGAQHLPMRSLPRPRRSPGGISGSSVAQRLGQLGLQALGARAVARDRHRAAASQRAGRGGGGRSGGRPGGPRARCSTSATSQDGHSHTCPQERQVRKFDHPRRLSSTIAFSPARAAGQRLVGAGMQRAAGRSRMSRPRRAAAAARPPARAGAAARRRGRSRGAESRCPPARRAPRRSATVRAS